MLAIDITAALGSSVLAFILGVFIGISLGYIIWSDRIAKKRGKNGIK